MNYRIVNGSISYGAETILEEINFEIKEKDKIAIIGENGTGKSTLLKTLNGNIPKIGGQFEYGYHVQKEYFDQQLEFLNPENTILEEITEVFPELTTTQIRTLLGTFLFSGEDVFKKINVLSGGERARLQLCKILKKQPNLLLLDEPTNHMDIVGKESLENILKEYTGTLIFVSHDRYFVNKIANCILEFSNEKVIFYNMNYQEYLESKQKNEEEENFNDKEKRILNNSENKNYLKSGYSQKEIKSTNSKNEYYLEKERNKIKNKIKKIESEIEQKENEIKEIEKEMQKEEISSDYLKLNELQETKQKLNKEIEKKMTEWEELNENL